MSSHPIELLAPAANAETAIQAILHGADAVYIGPPSHGARKNAANSIEDIKRVVDFAHLYCAKVYVTVNTIVYEQELKDVEKMIWDLYKIGVDALIVQDMGLLRLNLPPISLHASTQCDTRTVAKAKFLEEVGFSQLVLARELSLKEIGEICSNVSVPVETFIHGALCVSYSGRCHASQATVGRSANRGECAQICRHAYTMTDADGKVIAKNRYLLSLKDFNASSHLEGLMEAGVSSFKIEGRLKDISYVKNVVAFYRQAIDRIIATNPGKYERSSFGASSISFTPQLNKSFNRGFTTYFLEGPRPSSISSPLTPKSLGEEIADIHRLHNGDGISFFNSKNEYEGVMVNGIRGNRIIGNRPFVLPKGAKIYRTLDNQWQKTLSGQTATRKIWLDVTIANNYIAAADERGVAVRINFQADLQPAKSESRLKENFDKFGNSIYWLRNFTAEFDAPMFIPASQLAEARRRLLAAMDETAKAMYHFDYRRKENPAARYPESTLDYRDNVANSLARQFYREHGVTNIEDAMEIGGAKNNNGMRTVMTTRHCILREMGKCLKICPADKRNFKLPLYLNSGNDKFRLKFDCDNCQMEVIQEVK